MENFTIILSHTCKCVKRIHVIYLLLTQLATLNQKTDMESTVLAKMLKYCSTVQYTTPLHLMSIWEHGLAVTSSGIAFIKSWLDTHMHHCLASDLYVNKIHTNPKDCYVCCSHLNKFAFYGILPFDFVATITFRSCISFVIYLFPYFLQSSIPILFIAKLNKF